MPGGAAYVRRTVTYVRRCVAYVLRPYGGRSALTCVRIRIKRSKKVHGIDAVVLGWYACWLGVPVGPACAWWVCLVMPGGSVLDGWTCLYYHLIYI